MNTKINMDPNSKLGFTERFAYGAGDFASNIVYSAISIFLVFYYTDVIGMNAGVIGTIMLISRLFDGVSDLIMGIVVDRTKSKHGKARCWILRMAIPYAISAILLFSVPTGAGDIFKIIYVFISYNLVSTVIFTMINVPYATMNAMMTQNQYERGLLGIFRMLLATAGTMFINTFTLKAVEMFGGGPRAWTLTFTVFGLLTIGILFFTFYGTRERVVEEEDGKDKVSVKDGLIALAKNKYWCIVALCIFCLYFSLTLYGASAVYYAKSVLGDANLVTPIGNATTITQILTMFVTAFFIKKWGKRNIFSVGAILMAAGYLFIIVLQGNYTVLIAGNALKGIGAGCIASCMYGMLSDTIEYGQWKTGIRTAGLANAASSFGSKVGSGLGGAVLGWILAAGGYDGTAAVQTASALTAINTVYLYIPLVIALISFVILIFYKLDKEYPTIIKELNERK